MPMILAPLRCVSLALGGLLALTAAAPPPPGPSAAILPLLVGTAGSWQGQLQYRDYQSNRWEGLPVQVRIAVQGDGATLIRSAAFDDGPKTGTVWIITASQFDPASGALVYTGFRKGRPADSGSQALTLEGPVRDATHWTIVARETRRDGDSMAEVRETTTRDGDSMVTLKEVNPLDDGKDEWLVRNRTVLTRTGA